MEYNRAFENRPIYIWVADFWQRCKTSGKRIVFSSHSVITIGYHMHKLQKIFDPPLALYKPFTQNQS